MNFMKVIPLKYTIQLMRWDKPIGILLLLWPTLAALWLANGAMPAWKLIIIFSLGVLIMRSAGCVINDIADRKFDSQVTRTKQRPLASGQLSMKQAWLVFSALIIIALILVSQLNLVTFILAPWVLLLTIIYPFTKRFTYWPQFILGLTFNSSILMAFTAVQHSIPWIAIIFYISMVIWTIAYDTEYAMADYEDDKKIAIKSTALLFKQYSQFIIGIAQSLVLILWFFVGEMAQLPRIYDLGLVVIAGLMLYQHYLMAKKQPFTAFLNNQWIGLILFFTIQIALIG